MSPKSITFEEQYNAYHGLNFKIEQNCFGKMIVAISTISECIQSLTNSQRIEALKMILAIEEEIQKGIN